MEQTESTKKNWIKIYPNYLDKDLKHSEGRKVSSECSVSNPTVREIFVVCSEILKLDCKQESKHHPKDWLKRGRVLVGLKFEGKLVNPSNDIKKKNDLLKFVARTIGNFRSKVSNETLESGDSKKRRKNKK